MKERKICSKCGIEKDKTEFHACSTKKGGCQSSCKICASEYHKKVYQKKRKKDSRKVRDVGDKRICSVCGLFKEKSEYHVLSAKKGTLRARCKSCTLEHLKEKYWRDKDEESKKWAEMRKKLSRKEYRKEYLKAYRLKNDKKVKEQSKKYRDKNKGYSTQYYKENKDRINKQYLSRHHKRKEIDPIYVVTIRLRRRLRGLLNSIAGRKNKNKSFMDLVGCDKKTLKEHIESKFKDGMSWGRLGEIHIDHIKPCASFNLSDDEDRKKCFHYTNLQPLWGVENLIKGPKYNGIYYRKSSKRLREEKMLE